MSSLTKTRAPFYNIGQLRLKLWKDIRNNAIDFGKGKQTRDKLNHLSEEAQDILGQLSHVENYFAFPGYKAVSKLISFLENEDYISYAAQALDLTRSLIYNIYRIHPDFADDTEQ
ncbi:MAG TPA: hypothetical protein PKM16_09595, partial [Bacteroidia bacterium]|nr:hypothetical protein [Bacteroidia bacterium]